MFFKAQKFENRISGFSKFKRTKSLRLKKNKNEVSNGGAYKKPPHL